MSDLTDKEIKATATITGIILATVFSIITLVGGVYFISAGLATLGYPGIVSFTSATCAGIMYLACGVGFLTALVKQCIPTPAPTAPELYYTQKDKLSKRSETIL